MHNFAKISFSIVFVGLLSAPIFSQETSNAKIQKLKVTIDELTVRLSEVIKENKRLSQALKRSLEASHRGEKILIGCDVSALRMTIATPTSKSGKASVLHRFLLDKGKNCTKEQMNTIYKNMRKWADDSSGAYTDQSVPLIEVYLEN